MIYLESRYYVSCLSVIDCFLKAAISNEMHASINIFCPQHSLTETSENYESTCESKLALRPSLKFHSFEISWLIKN